MESVMLLAPLPLLPVLPLVLLPLLPLVLLPLLPLVLLVLLPLLPLLPLVLLELLPLFPLLPLLLVLFELPHPAKAIAAVNSTAGMLVRPIQRDMRFPLYRSYPRLA